MSFKKEKVGNINITPVIVQPFDPKTVHGYEWFHNPYNQVAMVARTKSGKTNLIYRILENTVKKDDNIMIFCPSVKTDATYKKMIKMLTQKKCKVKAHNHFIQGKRHLLNEFIAEKEGAGKQKGGKPEKLSYTNQTLEDMMFNGVRKPKKQRGDGDEEPKPKKNEKLRAKDIIIIDDLSTACRDPGLTRFLTRSRHMKTRVFISLHAITNLHPDGLRQVSDVFLFPNINRDKIEDVCDKCGISFKDDSKKRCILWELYQDATSEPYNFLNINRQEVTYKKNFNEQYNMDGQ